MPWSVVVVALTLVFAPSTIRAAESPDGGAPQAAGISATATADGGGDTSSTPAVPAVPPLASMPAASELERPGAPPASPPTPVPDPELAWPVEYVKRPLTVPEGMIVLGAGYNRIRPTDSVSAELGVPSAYFSIDKMNIGLTTGLTRDVELGVSVRGVACWSSSELGACDDGNRHAGSGVLGTVAILRRPDRHLAISGFLSRNSNRQLGIAGGLGMAGKMLLGDRVALEGGVSTASDLFVEQGISAYPTLFTLESDLNFQALRRVNTWADVSVTGPLDKTFSDGPRISVGAGASVTLGHSLSLLASWRRWHPGSRPNWDRAVPGTVITLSVQLFIRSTPPPAIKEPSVVSFPRTVFPPPGPPLDPINIPHPFEPVPVGP